MAAGDTSLVREGSCNGFNIEVWDVTTNGGAAWTIASKLSKIYAVFGEFTEDIGATAGVIEWAASGGTITINAMNTDLDKTMTLIVFGLT